MTGLSGPSSGKFSLRVGFSSSWTDLITQCCSTVSYLFLINDAAHGKVKPSRGIRQGDPLSLYIFILCNEKLSGLCIQAQESGHLTSIHAARRAPRINHLSFADDTIFFLKTLDTDAHSSELRTSFWTDD